MKDNFIYGGAAVSESKYITVKKEARAEFTEKRSRFIGSIRPVSSEQEAIAFINEIRSSFPDARHNVYAYNVLQGGVFGRRYSDDGEPQGTGGMPVLDVLLKQSIVNAAIVVTRYFGGVLLGAPGLVRAYGHAASLAVNGSGIICMELCRELTVTVDYSMYGKLRKCLEGYRCIIKPPEFGADITVKVILPDSDVGRLSDDIIDITSAVCLLSLGEKAFYNID